MGTPSLGKCRRYIVESDLTEDVSFVEIQRAEFGLADARCVLQHGLEHRLNFAGRARYDAEHLRCRGLLLQRIGKLVRALLLGLEQPRILDRDHRLVGEGLEQCDLFLGKRPHLHATDQNRSDRLPLPQQRSGERRSMTVSPSRLRPFRKFALRRPQIRDVHRGSINDGSADYQTTSYRTHRSDWPLREGAMFCDQP